jgi:FkbM family methyltransferase
MNNYMNYIIEYGTNNTKIDVTEIVFKKCYEDNIIYIPCGSGVRDTLFTNPTLGALSRANNIYKYIFILDGELNTHIYDENFDVFIDIEKNIITVSIPIVVFCYNNYKFVKNTVEQLLKINKLYAKCIKIIDNYSNDKDTIDYLESIDINIEWRTKNTKSWITLTYNDDLYHSLPNYFILTDPYLKFNDGLPKDFIKTMIKLSNYYKTEKIGFALDISDFDLMYQDYCIENKTIYDMELEYWTKEINNPVYELYELHELSIDATFYLINKKYAETNKIIRIGGNFTAKYLPWYRLSEPHGKKYPSYRDNTICNTYENYVMNKNTNDLPIISRLVIPYIESKYLKVFKNNELFFIENDKNNEHLEFWINKYSNWEKEMFKIFDKYLDKNKIFIDIGGCIGATCIYGSRKSKHTYSIESDIKSFDEMKRICNINCRNYTLINNIIFDKNNITVKFRKNKLQQSISKINDNAVEPNEFYNVKTITLKNIISTYNIDPVEISLIKVDIEGGEEYILNDLYEMNKRYKIPLYVSFHYSWWKNKNLNRFSILNQDHITQIQNNPFVPLLFE